MNKLNIVVFGAGAIGTTLAGWLTQEEHNTYLLTRKLDKSVHPIREVSITNTKTREVVNSRINLIDDLKSVPNIDLIIITVKNFQLEEACKSIKEKVGNQVHIIGLQNGMVNQSIIPKYFEKSSFGVVHYNTWKIEGSEWGYKPNGPILLFDNGNLKIKGHCISEVLNKVVNTEKSIYYNDAMYAKMVSNLINSVTTLIGNTHKEESSLKPLQYILSRLTYESIKTLRAAGVKELKWGALPPWWIITLGRWLPPILLKGLYRKKIFLVGSTSMAKDILISGKGESELDSINGQLLRLAKEHNVETPISEKLYKICESHFAQSPFKPLTARELKNLF